MLVGINQAWWLEHTYGTDFGGRPRTDPRHWSHGIDEVFAGYADIGLSIVRWWIFGEGAMLAPQPRVTNGHVSVGPPTALPAAVLDDFDLWHTKARQYHLRLVPTLVDFGLALAPQTPGADGSVKGGRSSWLSDATKRYQFFERVLEPLLEVSARYPDVIYAWDLINEPEWCTDVTFPMGTMRQPNVRLDDMKQFIRDGCARIARRRLPATVGFNDPATPRQWAITGAPVGRTQVHYYTGTTGSLSDTVAAQIVPGNPGPPANAYGPAAFLGEFPFSTVDRYAWMRPMQRTDTPVDSPAYEQSLYERLHDLRRLGYHAVLGWAYPKRDMPEGPTGASGVWSEVSADLRAYLGRPGRPSGTTRA